MSKTTVQNLIQTLMTKAEANMSDAELQQIAIDTGEEARSISGKLKDLVNGIACLVSCDKDAGTFRSPDDVSNLLFSVGHHVEIVEALIDLKISAECSLMIRNTNHDEQTIA